MGYASRAIELLSSYYEGKLTNLDEEDDGDSRGKKQRKVDEEVPTESTLHTEIPRPRKNLPPLLVPINDRGMRLNYPPTV